MLAHCAGDGDKKARSPGRARRKPSKPSRRECRIVWLTCGDYARMLFSFAYEAAGTPMYPAFPAPSAFQGVMFCKDSGAISAARMRRRASKIGCLKPESEDTSVAAVLEVASAGTTF